MSNAAFTDSITIALSFAFNARSGFGNSTKTTSEISFCAWSVIPTVAVFPSRRTHSCVGVYFSLEVSVIGLPLFSMFGWNKRTLHHFRRNAAAVHFDLDGRARRLVPL